MSYLTITNENPDQVLVRDQDSILAELRSLATDKSRMEYRYDSILPGWELIKTNILAAYYHDGMGRSGAEDGPYYVPAIFITYPYDWDRKAQNYTREIQVEVKVIIRWPVWACGMCGEDRRKDPEGWHHVECPNCGGS